MHSSSLLLSSSVTPSVVLESTGMMCMTVYLQVLMCFCLYTVHIAAVVGAAAGAITIIAVITALVVVVISVFIFRKKKTRVSVETINWPKEDEDRFVMSSLLVNYCHECVSLILL